MVFNKLNLLEQINCQTYDLKKKEIIHLKDLAQCLTHSINLVNIWYNYNDHSLMKGGNQTLLHKVSRLIHKIESCTITG